MLIFGIAAALAVVCAGISVLVFRLTGAVGGSASYRGAGERPRAQQDWYEQQPLWRQLLFTISVMLPVLVVQVALGWDPSIAVGMVIGVIADMLWRRFTQQEANSPSGHR